MKSFRASTQINAAPPTVWQILTDANGYADWDPNMIRLDGVIAPRNQLTIYTSLAPKRAFTPTVTEFEPPRRMVWKSGMPLGLFSGTRTFLLEPQGDGVTFTLTEEFAGPLLPLFGGSIPDMNPVFADFCAALKQRAEAAESA